MINILVQLLHPHTAPHSPRRLRLAVLRYQEAIVPLGSNQGRISSKTTLAAHWLVTDISLGMLWGYIRKRLPELTLVLSARKSLISINNSITSSDESGITRLKLHSVHDELHGQVTSMAGDGRSVSSVVALVERREGVSTVSVLVLEVPDDFVEDASPDRSEFHKLNGDILEEGARGTNPMA